MGTRAALILAVVMVATVAVVFYWKSSSKTNQLPNGNISEKDHMARKVIRP